MQRTTPGPTGLDILSTPSGPILAAQRLAAQAWGADSTWFLVNGSTGGIHAAVMACCGPSDALIVARNAHLSAHNAMVLAGCTPVYVQPCCDKGLGIAHHVSPAALEAAFEDAQQQGLRVAAALVVSPTYFGVMSDIAGWLWWAGGSMLVCSTRPSLQCSHVRPRNDT
jgi:arginine/lysine/ornithine decarboxylase